MWIVNLLRLCVGVCFPAWQQGYTSSWVFLCVFSLFGEHDSFSCNLQMDGLYFHPWLISDQQTALMQRVVLMTYNYFLNMTWRHALPLEPVSIVFPLHPRKWCQGQEVELWKLKELRTHYEVTGSRKEIHWAATGTSLFFSSYQKCFWSEKIWRGTLSHL